jgi:hypothetical protein
MYTLILYNVMKNLNFHIDNSRMESGRGQVHYLTLQQDYRLLHILVSSQAHHTADFNCMSFPLPKRYTFGTIIRYNAYHFIQGKETSLTQKHANFD